VAAGRGLRRVQLRDESGNLDEAAGTYTKTGTNANIWYGLVAKTLPVVGRFSVGYYGLNKKASVATVYDAAGVKGDDAGLLASWDRTMTEISEKLWVAVDYQAARTPTAPPVSASPGRSPRT